MTERAWDHVQFMSSNRGVSGRCCEYGNEQSLREGGNVMISWVTFPWQIQMDCLRISFVWNISSFPLSPICLGKWIISLMRGGHLRNFSPWRIATALHRTGSHVGPTAGLGVLVYRHMHSPPRSIIPNRSRLWLTHLALTVTGFGTKQGHLLNFHHLQKYNFEIIFFYICGW